MNKDKIIEELKAALALSQNKPIGKWSDKAKVLSEAKKHRSKQEWRIKSIRSYDAAKILGCMGEATAHMTKERKATKVPAGFWDVKQNVLDDAKKSRNKREWRVRSCTAYQKASNNGWLKEVTFRSKKDLVVS